LRIAYDPKADAMNVRFQEGEYEISKEIGDGIIIDYTRDGRVLSIEMLDVSKRMPIESIKDITIGVLISPHQ
jgi:uncharacterized protein YuzE